MDASDGRDVMNIVNISLIAIVGVITAVIVKGYKPEISLIVIIALSLFFLAWMLEIFEEMQSRFQAIAEELEQNKSFYKILFKIMGITYICEFSSGICKDAGHSSIAGQIEILGKMLVLLSGIPVLLSVIQTIQSYG